MKEFEICLSDTQPILFYGDIYAVGLLAKKEGAGFRTMLMKVLALNSLSALVQKKQYF